MSAVLGTNATKLASPIGSNIVDQGYIKAGVEVMVDFYTAAALAVGSTITVGGVLPVGAVILGVVLQHEAFGATTTISIGDAGSATRYNAAADTELAGVVRSSLNLGYKVTGTSDTQIVLTTAGDTLTGNIAVAIFYSL